MIHYNYSTILKKIYPNDLSYMVRELKNYKNDLVLDISCKIKTNDSDILKFCSKNKITANLSNPPIDIDKDNVIVELEIKFNLENNERKKEIINNEVKKIETIIKECELDLENNSNLFTIFGYDHCIVDIEKEKIPVMVKEIESYKSDIVHKIKNVTIINNNNEILEFCKKNNIKSAYDVGCNIIQVDFEIELNIKPREDLEILEDYEQKMYGELDNLIELIDSYENYWDNELTPAID